MSAYPPTSAAKALGLLAVVAPLAYGGYYALAQQTHVVHTKSYYMQHIAEQTARLEWCNDNPGIARQDPDCQAAVAAHIGW